MYLISFLLVINSFVVTPVNQKLVFRPSFLTSTELESLTVHLSHLRDLTASVQESGSQSGIYKIHNEKEKLAKYRLVLQNEFEKQRRFLASKGLLSAIPRVDATEKEITGKFNELGKAIDNQDFEKVSSLLKYATPPPFPVDTQPPYQMLEPGKRIEPVKEGKRGIRTGPPTPDDTLPTIDVRITPEIKALAQQLGYDPRKIYEYVKNNVNYDPFYGSMKGSLGALYEQYGNDIDQASLLIALLRASGIPSRYVRGVITLSPSGAANMLGVVSRKRIIPTLLRSRIPFTPNTIGDSLVSVDMEYVWVRAYIPIQHYMGIPTGDERGKVWLPMFPAFKKLKITEGINLPEAMGFDFEEFFKDFIVNNPEAKTPIELYREKLTNYLNQNYPGKTYEEILLKEGVIEEKFQTLPLTSPVKVKYITDEFAEVPDELRHKLTLEVKATYSNNQYLIQTIPMPTVFSRRFTLDYAPATSEDSAIVSEYGGIMQTPPYLIELKPVVRIGGKIVAIGSPIGSSFMDCQLTLICSIKEPGHQLRTTAAAIRGNTAGLGMFQSPTDRILTNPPAESLDTDGAAAANMYICLADYFPKTAKDRDEINRTIQARVANYYTFGIVSNQLALGGAWEPLSTQWVGLYIDVPLIRILASPIKGEYDIKDPILGMNGSYWENMVFENRYEVPAISSAKGFRVADSLGIPIYKVNLSGISNLFGERGGKPAGRAAVKSSTPSMMTPPVRMSLEKVEDEVIVRFTRKVGKRGMKETLDKIISGTEVLKTSHGTNAVLLKLPSHLSIQSAVQTLKSNPNVLYTEPNYRYAAQSIAPNDPFFENEWGIRKCLINAAWDSTTGDSSIIIAFLDTGVDTLHPEFVNRIIPGYDFVNEDSFAYDDQGHGTMVAGVIGAEANNSIGIAGIDWKGKLLPVKVLNELGVGTVFDAAEGIYYAIEKNARILNLSLGGYDPSSYLAEAVDSAYNSGCVIIGGAGNDGTSQPFYPAAYPNVIGVSATKENDLIAYFSNYGDYIDVSAPGVNIYTTERDSGYLIASGTSMSCAYVSGVVGLLLGDNPLLTNADIYNILKERSDDLGSPGWDGFYGYGRVNAYRALVGEIVIKPVIAGYEITGGNLNGYAEAGETFDVNLTLRNAGDSTAYDVAGLLTCADSNVTILADSGYYGDLEPEGTETVAYRVSFSSSLPKGSVVKFNLNITASGFGFTEEWTIKEGDLLSILNISDASKQDIRNYILQGFDMYVPQSAYVYDYWAGEHYFGYNSKTYAGGWWIRGRCFGGATVAGVEGWNPYWLGIFKKGCTILSIIPEILAPADSTVYHQGDKFTLKVKYNVTIKCPGSGPSTHTVIEDYVIDTEHLPVGLNTLYVEGHDVFGTLLRDQISVLVFTFNIDEVHTTKYFNPYSGDLAKIIYNIIPYLYAYPNLPPTPLNFTIKITDKDGETVCEERALTTEQQIQQQIYWNGKNDQGEIVELTQSPYEAALNLQYQNDKYVDKTTLIDLLEVDLDMAGVIDEEEETVGGFISLNNDDDNENGISDKDETSVVGENDLIEITVNKVLPEEAEGSVVLKASNGTKIWDSPTKETEVILPMMYETPYELPKSLWVEGTETSGALRDMNLTLEYSPTPWGMYIYKDIIKLTIFEVDLDINGIADEDEETIGGFISLNNDDDNENTIPDKDETGEVENEDDLAKITLRMLPEEMEGEVSFTLTGVENIKIWESSTKGNEVSLPVVFQAPSELPREFWVEGFNTSTTLRDVELTLNFSSTVGTHRDEVKTTTFKIDLDIDDVAEEDEETIGGFISLNNDDDNENGIPDKDETGEVENEDDLVSITLQVEPEELPIQVTLNATTGTENIKIWETSTKGNEIPFPITYDVPTDLPMDLWVEGFNTSSELRDVELTLEYKPNDVSYQDKVKLTTLEVDLDINAVADEDEETIGGFVPLNNDDDNENGIPDKDETGEVENEDDLVSVILRMLPEEMEGEVTLALTGEDNIKIWESSIKGIEVLLPAVFQAPSELPIEFWVEGFNTRGELRDVELTLNFSSTVGSHQDEVKVTIFELDLIATDLYGPVQEENEEDPGAFVHFNLDNDNNSDNSIGAPKHPGGDYLELGQVSGENDLKLAKIKIEPLLESGRIELVRDNSNIRVWSSYNKGADKKVLFDNDVKSWNLAIPSERQEFLNLKDNLYVEGLGYNAESRLFNWYYDAAGKRWCGDLVKYTFIAADCGRQPKTDNNERIVADQISGNNIIHCEWSITKEANPFYNCIAWSVGEENAWYVDIEANRMHSYDIVIDNPPWGNGDGVMTTEELNSFYDAKDYEPTTAQPPDPLPLDAEIIYYDGFHGARRRACNCGAGKWIMFESKCGEWIKMEHVYDQLNGGTYGMPERYYKQK